MNNFLYVLNRTGAVKIALCMVWLNDMFMEQGFQLLSVQASLCLCLRLPFELSILSNGEAGNKSVMMDAGQMMLNIVRSCIGTKFTSRFGTLIAVSFLLL